jgi:hypothetical protein
MLRLPIEQHEDIIQLRCTQIANGDCDDAITELLRAVGV